MPYLIRSVLFAVALVALWSVLWFQEDGLLVQIPGVGGYFFQYGGQ